MAVFVNGAVNNFIKTNEYYKENILQHCDGFYLSVVDEFDESDFISVINFISRNKDNWQLEFLINEVLQVSKLSLEEENRIKATFDYDEKKAMVYLNYKR